jgi:uncharacterized protein YPO0396
VHEGQVLYGREYGPLPDGGSDDITPYRERLVYLEATELPQYREQVARARADAEIEFREHFIHQLREQIQAAQARLDELNAALRQVSFSGTRYRFHSEPSPEYQAYYELITRQESELLGLPLLQGEFYQRHREVIDDLFNQLTGARTPSGPDESERLRDYRAYLTYDIELIQEDGRRERFSKVARTQSGGKTQAPYYVAMVAAFAQLYRVQHPRQGDTVRLIVFDEAFNRMDRENTASALEMMRHYGLQVVTATPPRRFDEIAPYMQTCIYLARSGPLVVATPYYNGTAASPQA